MYIDGGVPSDYPVALNGLGAISIGQRVDDLLSFGLITETEKFVILGLIKAGRVPEAEAIIAEKEQKALSKKGKDFFAWIPPGYKFHEQLIPGVANWSLYVGSAVAAALMFRSMRKKR